MLIINSKAGCRKVYQYLTPVAVYLQVNYIKGVTCMASNTPATTWPVELRLDSYCADTSFLKSIKLFLALEGATQFTKGSP